MMRYLDSAMQSIAGPASRELVSTLRRSMLICSRHWHYQGEIGATLLREAALACRLPT
ncbi:hypothetical protein A2U01_0114681 [Trifolium medium]|uniref:Uncharacterized protein n=1 Tax=Trifolium medium TaxID=97028 RepID=A0A392W107_9FABA|nr:hypothetical protein [Trifolium medium]